MADEQDNTSFYLLGDEAMGVIATAAPIRHRRNGRSDISGRLRVAAILRKAGITAGKTPERIAGSTNEVWRAGDYIVRVGFVDGAERLRREAHLAELLPAAVRYPEVVASGVEQFGEWIIVRRCEGVVLSQAWGQMTFSQRRASVHQFANAMKAVHQTVITPERASEFEFHEGLGSLALPHQLATEHLIEMLDRLNANPYVDSGVVSAAIDRVTQLEGIFPAHERYGLVHGDLHFENVLTANGVIVALLDFEWSRPGPREIDLDVLASFCTHPDVHVGGNYPVNAADYRQVLSWANEVYPDWFADEQLSDRLMLCALGFEVPSLAATPPNGPASDLSEHHPMNRLKDLLTNGTQAERLGWNDPTKAEYFSC